MADTNLNFVLEAENRASDGIDSVKRSLGDLDDSEKSVSDTSEKTKTSFGKFVSGIALGNIVANLAQRGFQMLENSMGNIEQVTNDNQNQMAQLNAVIKSTGDASGLSAQQQSDYADKLSETTPTTKDAIIAGENMISTFTGIKGTAFEGATQAANNMATFFNGGLAPSMQQVSNQALQIGKALNDPATGMAKLQREGVSFSAQEQEQIKTMSAAGNVAGAQAVMLQELTTEFGNAGTAAGQTFSGGLQMAKNSLNEVEASAGTAFENALLPAIQQVVPLISSLSPIVAMLAKTFGGLGSDVAAVLPNIIDIVEQLVSSINLILPSVGPVLVIISQLAEDFMSLLFPVLNALAPIFPVLIGLFSDMENTINGLLQAALPIFIGLIGDVVSVLKILLPPISQIIEALGGAFEAVFKSLQPVMPILANALKLVALAIAQIIVALAPLIPVLATFVVQIVQALLPYLPQLIDAFLQMLPAIVELVPPLVQLITAVLPILTDLLTILIPIIGDVLVYAVRQLTGFIAGFSSALSTVISWITTAIEWVSKMGSQILNAVSGFGTLLYDVGRNLINGLIKGITDVASTIGNTIKNISDTIVSGFKNLLGIHSPSTVFAEIGANLGQGLQQGLQGSQIGVKASVTQLAGATLNSAQAGLSNAASIISPSALSSSQQQNVQPASQSVTLTLNIGLYAGLPSEKRAIAVDLYNSLRQEARAHNVQLPSIGVGNIQ